ncbi:hypothetical protein RHSIM_Rhsim05G0042600 [Rhododendron simsii]|uniref:Retroviral polymerase SH3-like domain-containing protein n=1 Tax=Rhododendron simsii TaxID=118357 RepID=A0A834LNA9_RHOSS|nr:hypothetical protein RHSIM_Rhsim05G0042600 [Rhododendron simsii]
MMPYVHECIVSSTDTDTAGYSNTSRAFRVYNLRTSTLVESANVVVDDTTLDQSVPQVNDDDEGSWEIFEGEFQANSLDEGVSSEEVVDIPTSVDEEVANDSEVEVDEPLEDKELGQHNLVPLPTKEPSARVKLNHPISQVIGAPNDEMKTRRQIRNEINYVCFTSTLEPKKVEEALGDDYWIGAMQEELEQFVRNDVWPWSRVELSLQFWKSNSSFIG